MDGMEGGSSGGSGQGIKAQSNNPTPNSGESLSKPPGPEGGSVPETSVPSQHVDLDPKNATGTKPAETLLAEAKKEGPHQALENLAAGSSGVVKTPESDVEQTANLKKEYLAASKLGREVLGVVQHREQRRLTPFNDPRRFPSEDVRAVQTKRPDVNSTEEDIKNAERASFSLALEAATQVAEVQLPRTGGVREELDPLEALARIVKKGYSVGVELSKEDRQGMMDVAKSAIARRERVTPDKITWDDKKIESWAIEQFDAANKRLARSVQAIRGYVGR